MNNYVNAALPLASGKIWIGSVGNIATPQTPSGDLTVSNAGVFTFGTVNANVGSFGSATQCATVTVNAKGLITAASQAPCTPAIGSITGLAANMATWLGTPSSANLRATVTDETGNGLLYFQGGDIGTPSAGNGSNLTSLNATQLTTGTVPAARLPLTNTSLAGQPSNPTSTTSASAVQMGLGVSTCRITPTYSGRLLLTIDGAVLNNGAGNLTNVVMRYGTGAGPANGAAFTGTQATAQTSYGNGGTTFQSGFSKTATVTGLSPGTAYWFDLTLAVTAGTGSVSGLTCSAMEF